MIQLYIGYEITFFNSKLKLVDGLTYSLIKLLFSK